MDRKRAGTFWCPLLFLLACDAPASIAADTSVGAASTAEHAPPLEPASGEEMSEAMLDSLAPSRRWLASPVEGELHVFVEHGVRPTAEGERMHRGIDVRAPAGALVLAVDAGEVARVDTDPKAGVRIELLHTDGVRSVYGGLSQPAVVPTTRVERGAVLGVVGRAHPLARSGLHFEVLEDEGPVDPLERLGTAR